ncbi:MAG: carboxypeptidase regulatory-like domain-containing protein [Terriglobales bacterium]|jgi:plastocyanin
MSRSHLAALMFALSSLLGAQDATVRGTVSLVHRARNESSSSDVIVWLTPAHSSETVPPGATVRLVQKNKRFIPHVQAVTLGTEIEFPNQDPFFHDVFSIYHGKPFDLGLYESGSIRKIKFTQPGVSYIFCNIHPEMSAAVLVLRTPYFAVTGDDGSFRINQLTPGQYKLEVWYEFSPESELAALSQTLQIAAGENILGVITLHSSDAPQEHLNKYGEPYSSSMPDKY